MSDPKKTASQAASIYVLEPMRLEDLARVATIERATFTNPWPEEAFEHEIHNNPFSHPTVARTGGPGPSVVVGYYVIWIVADELHIQNIAVHPSHQRRGLGRFLLADAIEKGTRAGAERASLEVRESNLVAQRLYASMGFREVGRRKDYYNRPREDAIVYQKDLLFEP